MVQYDYARREILTYEHNVVSRRHQLWHHILDVIFQSEKSVFARETGANLGFAADQNFAASANLWTEPNRN